MRAFLTVGVLLLLSGPAAGQSEDLLQPRWLVEAPTAGLATNGALATDLRFFDGNGVLGGVEITLFNRFLVGFSFGGENIIGRQAANWNPNPGWSGRIRAMDETRGRPALAIGFSSQGFGRHDDRTDRYATKSLGAYGVFSKNYGNPWGQGSLHFGLNRSLEDEDGDGDLTGFVGVETEIRNRLTLIAEYHFALNDDGVDSLGRGRGLLHGGARWWFSRRMAIEFDLKDVLRNAKGVSRPGREVRLFYVGGL